MRRFIFGLSLCAALASVLPAQQNAVEAIITNISNSSGLNPDCLAVIQNGQYRVLAQEKGGATGSTGPSPYLITVGGVDYLYWFDNIVDRVIRARDANGNGALDPTEFETAWDGAAFFGGSTISPDAWSWNGRVAYVPNDFNGAGVVRLEDLNGDGIWDQLGEQMLVFDGSVGTVAGLSGTQSVDDIETAHEVTGRVIYYEDDDRVIGAYNPGTGAHDIWFNWSNPNFPIHPDISNGRIPTPLNDLDRITVDYSTTPETVYMAVNFTSSSPYIYSARDLNMDGDVMDSGEVRLFVDGNLASPPIVAVDDIQWYRGSLYVSHEVSPSGANAGEIFEFTDLNGNLNATDPGEQALIGGLPATNDPSILGLGIVPAGTFGPSCVEANIETSGVTSAGGVLTFTVDDILAARQTGFEAVFVGISATPGGSTFLAPGCSIGLTADFLTIFMLNNFLPQFTTAQITSSSSSTPGFIVPAGVTGKIYYAGLFIGGSFGVTQTKCLDIQ